MVSEYMSNEFSFWNSFISVCPVKSRRIMVFKFLLCSFSCQDVGWLFLFMQDHVPKSLILCKNGFIKKMLALNWLGKMAELIGNIYIRRFLNVIFMMPQYVACIMHHKSYVSTCFTEQLQICRVFAEEQQKHVRFSSFTTTYVMFKQIKKKLHYTNMVGNCNFGRHLLDLMYMLIAA